MDELEFVDGLIVKAPHAKAPSFVKAQIAIRVEDLGKWLRAKYKAGDEWINVDVKESKGGRWYAAVSTFKPKEKGYTLASHESGKETMDDDIPF